MDCYPWRANGTGLIAHWLNRDWSLKLKLKMPFLPRFLPSMHCLFFSCSTRERLCSRSFRRISALYSHDQDSNPNPEMHLTLDERPFFYRVWCPVCNPPLATSGVSLRLLTAKVSGKLEWEWNSFWFKSFSFCTIRTTQGVPQKLQSYSSILKKEFESKNFVK